MILEKFTRKLSDKVERYGKRLFFLLLIMFFLLIQNHLNADTLSIDIRHYSINLKILDFQGKYIEGECCIQFEADQDSIARIFLWLKALEVDSVKNGNIFLTYQHADELLYIDLDRVLMKDDTFSLCVYYSGIPAKDPYWGGFYFAGEYAFNLGVAFTDLPHNYGRVWYPCIDNFTDKATYSYFITTDTLKKAVCSGMLVSKSFNADNTITWHYELDVEIPTYLSSVAVGPYVFLEMEFTGKERNIPVLLACHPSDTNKLRQSFINLENALNIFEESYYPFQFPRIGYVVVPFNSGAMEHACNIAYPRFAVNGNLSYEDLMVHEFAHNWWGNLITCSSAGDMWINEGWARFSEHLFIEKQYGRERYMDAVRNNNRKVLQYAHFSDGEPYPLTPLPSNATYGAHSYNKAASVIHTLRTYLGDSLFFHGISRLMHDFRFKSIDSYRLRDSFSSYTSINLDEFFDDWVFTPGFPHFQAVLLSNSEDVIVEVNTRLRFRDKALGNVPLNLVFMDNNWNTVEKKVIMRGDRKEFSFSLAFKPDMVFVNMNNEISDAKSASKIIIKENGNYTLPLVMMDLKVNEVEDSAMIYIEHHWVGPSNNFSNLKGIRLSNYRYYSVCGIFGNDLKVDARFRYNGNTTSMNGNDCLDHTLNIINEDSLVLLYRKNMTYPWEIYDNYKIFTGSLYDKNGIIDIFDVKKGDYCLAIYDHEAVFDVPLSKAAFKLIVFPNPASTSLNIKLPEDEIDEVWSCQIITIDGKLINEYDPLSGKKISISLENIENGLYIVKLKSKDKVFFRKILVQR